MVQDRSMMVVYLDRILHFVRKDLVHKDSFFLHIHVLYLDFRYVQVDMYIWQIHYPTMYTEYSVHKEMGYKDCSANDMVWWVDLLHTQINRNIRQILELLYTQNRDHMDLVNIHRLQELK